MIIIHFFVYKHESIFHLILRLSLVSIFLSFDPNFESQTSRNVPIQNKDNSKYRDLRTFGENGYRIFPDHISKIKTSRYSLLVSKNQLQLWNNCRSWRSCYYIISRTRTIWSNEKIIIILFWTSPLPTFF